MQLGEPRILRRALAGRGVRRWPTSLLFEPGECLGTPLLKLMPTYFHAGAQTPRESRQCLDGRFLEPVSARTRDWAEGECPAVPLRVDILLS